MQNLDVISVNIWHIVISLCNLVLLYLILKKFLYKPVRKVLEERRKSLDDTYKKADQALIEAEENSRILKEKLNSAEDKAKSILDDASKKAQIRSEQTIAEAKEKAESIIEDAQIKAELEKKKAQSEIRREIVDVSAVLAEKMIKRELNLGDHNTLIDSVIDEIGEDDDSGK